MLSKKRGPFAFWVLVLFTVTYVLTLYLIAIFVAVWAVAMGLVNFGNTRAGGVAAYAFGIWTTYSVLKHASADSFDAVTARILFRTEKSIKEAEAK